MILEIKNISKSYGHIQAITNFSLNVKRGERIVILGPSGCGKTTLLRIIAGFIQPDNGKVIIDGQIVADGERCIIEPENRQLGMVFQDLAFWPHMSVYKNLEFGLKEKKNPQANRKKLIKEIFQKVQMTQFKNAYPNNLSGRQQQRVALARALVLQPKILLMDEPLSNLDYDLNLMLRREILRLQEELDITMLYVTHAREEAFSLATRIIVMEHGQIKIEGSAHAISKYFQNSVIHD